MPCAHSEPVRASREAGLVSWASPRHETTEEPAAFIATTKLPYFHGLVDLVKDGFFSAPVLDILAKRPEPGLLDRDP